MADIMAKLKNVVMLKDGNYTRWTGDMAALLRVKALWTIVNGLEPKPTDPTAAVAWEVRAQMAAGCIYLTLDEPQKVHVKDQEDDPIKMWQTLKGVHQQKRPATRFTAYEALFSIQKRDDETLPQLAARISEAMYAVKDLRPAAMTLDDLDSELMCMAMIRALPSEHYAAFRSTMLLLPQMDVGTLTEAFQLEEDNRQASAAASCHDHSDCQCD